MPDDAIYIDEVTTHTGLLRQHLVWNKPQSLFTRQGGLGQGLGLSLGIKLSKPERQVVTLRCHPRILEQEVAPPDGDRRKLDAHPKGGDCGKGQRDQSDDDSHEGRRIGE